MLTLFSSLIFIIALIFIKFKLNKSHPKPVITQRKVIYMGEERRKQINQLQYKINEILRTIPNQLKRRSGD